MSKFPLKTWILLIPNSTTIAFGKIFSFYSQEKYGPELKLTEEQKLESCKELILLLAKMEEFRGIKNLDMIKSPTFSITDQLFVGLKDNKWKNISTINLGPILII